MRLFVGHVHTYGSASLKRTTDLAYYRSNYSVEIAIQGYNVDEVQVQTTVATQANWPAQLGSFLRLNDGNISVSFWYVRV